MSNIDMNGSFAGELVEKCICQGTTLRKGVVSTANYLTGVECALMNCVHGGDLLQLRRAARDYPVKVDEISPRFKLLVFDVCFARIPGPHGPLNDVPLWTAGMAQTPGRSTRESQHTAEAKSTRRAPPRPTAQVALEYRGAAGWRLEVVEPAMAPRSHPSHQANVFVLRMLSAGTGCVFRSASAVDTERPIGRL